MYPHGCQGNGAYGLYKVKIGGSTVHYMYMYDWFGMNPYTAELTKGTTLEIEASFVWDGI